jgi:hypothetical protein
MIAGLGVFLVALLLFELRERRPEPTFEGKSLGFWLHLYDSTLRQGVTVTDPIKHDEAAKAVRAIGSNAVPFLIEMIRFQGKGADRRNSEGVCGFLALGPVGAGGALPLAEVLASSNSSASQWAAGRALCAIGLPASNAVPNLMQATHSTNSLARLISLFVLNNFRIDPEKVIPLLVQSFQDREFDVQLEAISGAGKWGAEAARTVPDLVLVTKNTNPRLRRVACGALGNIANVPQVAIPALLDALHDPVPFVRAEAAWALGRFEAKARIAVPALKELLHDEDREVRFSAEKALTAIDRASE